MERFSLVSKIAPLNASARSAPHPAIVFLHGRGTDEDDLLGLISYLDPRFLIVSVRAPFRFEYGGYTWFDLDENGRPDIDQLITSRDSFIKWINGFLSDNQVDPQKIVLFGFSMGAMMSLTLSLSNPHLFKGVIAHSGLLLQDQRLSYRWNDISETSFLIAHGSQDPIVSVEFGREAYRQLQKMKANVQYHEYPIPHSISDESMTDISAWLTQFI